MEGGEIMFKLIVHPGEILKDELDYLDVTPTEFARQIDVPPNRISQIIAGKRSITGDTALRFGHWFGVDPQFWLNLQGQYELAVADRQVGKTIRHLPTKERLPIRRDPAEAG
jgi:addiction module HigA family antidote